MVRVQSLTPSDFSTVVSRQFGKVLAKIRPSLGSMNRGVYSAMTASTADELKSRSLGGGRCARLGKIAVSSRLGIRE
jgi:hypothetical protein